MYAHSRTHTHTHTHTHIYIYLYMYICIYIYTSNFRTAIYLRTIGDPIHKYANFWAPV